MEIELIYEGIWKNEQKKYLLYLFCHGSFSPHFFIVVSSIMCIRKRNKKIAKTFLK